MVEYYIYIYNLFYQYLETNPSMYKDDTEKLLFNNNYSQIIIIQKKHNYLILRYVNYIIFYLRLLNYFTCL